MESRPIQFMLRVEREARAQRCPLLYRELMGDDMAEPFRLAKRDSLTGPIFNPPRQRECG